MTVLKYIFMALVIGLVFVITLTNPRPHSRDDIAALSEQLFEFGAVRYVHALESERILQAQSLFDAVAQGQVLDAAQSCTYRTAYWLVLQDYDKRFQIADNDLHMATDFGTGLDNNCAGNGIAGAHDLHDVSALQNFTELVENLDALDDNAGWFQTVFLINEINKDLVDLTVHMAPATHSIGVLSPDFVADGRLSDAFNAMQQAYKSAQFAPINSEDYWAQVTTALGIYVEIVAASQHTIMENSGSLQRRLAGRWLSLQTVAPRLDINACVRWRPNVLGDPCS